MTLLHIVPGLDEDASEKAIEILQNRLSHEQEAALEYLQALIDYYSDMISDDRKAISELDELDFVSSNIIQDHVQQLEKFQWFMRSHLE